MTHRSALGAILRSTQSAERTLPEISRFFGIVIQMFWAEHRPPHFHARYGDYRCAASISTLEVMQGHLPRRAMALTLEWASLHREALMEDWTLCEKRQTPRQIPPLE